MFRFHLLKEETPQLNLNIVSLKELSKLLGKSEASIRYHIRMGRITPTLLYGRVMAFDPDGVLRQLQRGIPSKTPQNSQIRQIR